jgi:hypothetical protein
MGLFSRQYPSQSGSSPSASKALTGVIRHPLEATVRKLGRTDGQGFLRDDLHRSARQLHLSRITSESIPLSFSLRA